MNVMVDPSSVFWVGAGGFLLCGLLAALLVYAANRYVYNFSRKRDAQIWVVLTAALMFFGIYYLF